MSYHRGDVVLVLFPDSNLRTSKRRPALVVQSDQIRTELAQTVVGMITSNMARAGHRSRVIVPAASANAKCAGLLMDSVTMTDNLATVQYSEMTGSSGAFLGWAISTRRCARHWPSSQSPLPTPQRTPLSEWDDTQSGGEASHKGESRAGGTTPRCRPDEAISAATSASMIGHAVR
jgi:mRNA interferase MazF